MLRPSVLRVARWVVFAAVLLASSSIREGPSSAVNQAIIWFPTGVAIAGLCVLGLRAWWVIALTTILQRHLIGYEFDVSLPAAAGSTAEAIAGVLVLRRLGFRPALDRLRDVAALMAAAIAAPLASIFFSWLGRGYFWSNPQMPFYSGWDGWWRMNALGALTVVPFALLWLAIPRREITPGRALLTAAAVVAIPAILFGTMCIVPPGITGVMTLNLVIAPLALYVAGRHGARGATLAGTLAALVVAVATTHGYGPFLELPRDQRHVALQLFELAFVAIPPAFSALLAERRAALEEGARSDELRRSIQSAFPDITYRLRRDGTCLEVFVPPGITPPVPPERMIGRSIFEWIARDRANEICEQVARALETEGLATIEYPIDIDGERRMREARCVPHGDGEILAVVREITERKWAESTTTFEARVLALVATGCPPADVFAAIVAGMEDLSPGGRCSIIVLEGRRMRIAMAPSLPDAFNAAVDGVEIGPRVGSCGAAASLGRTIVVREIATDPLWEDYRHLALPFDLNACWSVPIRDSIGSVLGTFAVYYGQPRVPEIRELALAERAAALAGIVLEREQRSDDLRRSEDLLASINRNVNEGLFRADTSLHLIYANRAFARMFGLDSVEAVLKVGFVEALPDAGLREGMLRVAAEGGEWSNEEVLFRRRDGSTFWGLVSGTAVRGPDGAIAYYDGVIADITARKQLEEQFRQSQKMEAVGKLAGGVAHDFNNLLTVITGYADAIRSEAGERDALGAYAGHVLDAAGRASGLTRQLLAYSRQQVLSPRELELNAVVDRMGGMLRRLIGEDVRLVIEHRSGPCWVRVDPSQIEQVLLNLSVNARDAMRGGTLTIATETGAFDARRMGASAVLAGPCVLLSVCDTGSGMPPDVKSRAFDPFFTTKEPGRGTGLGLSTVYGIVQQSGGAIWLESAEGSGTSVWIALPRSSELVETAEATAAPGASRRTGTVMVVEDEPAVRALVCRTLAREGCRVLEAPDGQRALELARENAGGIDLVVTDVVMPRLGGREMAAQLLAERPGLRFLFISGYPDDARALDEFVGSSGAFLPKPFAPNQLVESVRALLEASASRSRA